MTFGEALRHELIQIQQLVNKVFPVVAPQDTEGTFLVYKRNKINVEKTLSGRSNLSKASYSMSLVYSDYEEKEQIEKLISDKVMSFFSRNIGDNGPFIQDVTFTLQDEQYAYEPDKLSSSMLLEVVY